MKKYLKMVDVFRDEMRVVGDSKNMLADDVGIIIGCYSGDKMAEYVLHAINSHDELVQMNKELLADIKRVIRSSKEFDKIMGTSEWADGYKQCAIDTGEALRVILDNIKAKGTA